MCHSEVEVCLRLEGKKVLAKIFVVWVVKFEGVPLLVECMNMLEVVEGVPKNNVVTHTIVEGRSMKLVMSPIAIVDVVVESIVSYVIMVKPFDRLVMKSMVFAMVLVKFVVVHAIFVGVLGGFVAARAVVAKVLGEFVVAHVVSAIVVVGTQFFVPTSFDIPTVVLISLVVW